MPDAPGQRRRETLTGRKIKQYLNQQVKIFLKTGVALDGTLLDYFWDPIEKIGVLTLSSHKSNDHEPSLVFRHHVTTIQPATTKDANGVHRKPR